MTDRTRGAVHRRSGWLGLVVCVVVALVLAAITPDPDTDLRRAWVDVRVGTPAVEPDLTTTVDRVQVARSAARSYGAPFASRQRLVLVRLRVAVRHHQRLFSQVSLLSRDGLSYEPRDEFVSQGLAATEPGFTRTSTAVFEVPADRVAGARLVIDSDEGAFDVYATATRVDLGLTGTTPVRSGAVKVPDSTVQVTR